MRAYKIVGIITLLALAAGFKQEESNIPSMGWKLYVGRQKEFSILLPTGPDSPEYFALAMPLGKTDETIPGHRMLAHVGNVWYIVDYIDFPSPVTKDVLNTVLNGYLEGKRGDCTTISVGENKGLECRWQGERGQEINRIFPVNNRIYSLQVSRPKETMAPDETEKFLSSFKIAGQK